jgi:hypothetical protein
MAAIKFKFSVPGKSKDAASEPESKKDDAKPEEEKADDSPEYTKAELGKLLASAIKSGDGEAIFEAYKKLSTCTPSDE